MPTGAQNKGKNHPMFGKKHSLESRQKMSDARKGAKMPEATKIKISQALKGKMPKNMEQLHSLKDENHPRWKEDNVGYSALHRWIRKKKGKPKKCSKCNTINKKLYWANIDHSYTRNLSKWISICCKCHRKFDKKYNIGQKYKGKEYIYS